MKKVVFILALAVAMTLAACNGSNEASTSSTEVKSGETVAPSTSATNENSPATVKAQGDNVAAGEAAAQPGDANVTPAKPQQAPKAPFSAEDAVKYKEGIKLVKEYSEELNKCVEAKMSGKAIDVAPKQRIAELQNKLGELEKAGKMNQQLLDLKKVNDDVYNKVIAK